MKEQAIVQENMVEQNLKAELAAHMGEQPGFTQWLHRLMNWLTAASVAVPVALFVRALALSINWKATDGVQIAVAWFTFVASGTVPLIVLGLHSALVRAFPAVPIKQLASQLVTGGKAVATGVGFMVVGATVAGFWGAFAYAVTVPDWALLEQLVRILAAAAGVGATIAVIQSLFRQISRSL
jgi:hypothetical protein